MITNQTAVEALEALETQWESQKAFTQVAVDTVVSAVHGSLTFRDYVFGTLPSEYGADGAIKIAEALLPLIEETNRAPFYTMLATWYYETGDRELAMVSLITSLALDPSYSLSKLIERVFLAGAPEAMFASMRGELHPKVSGEIFADPELVIA